MKAILAIFASMMLFVGCATSQSQAELGSKKDILGKTYFLENTIEDSSITIMFKDDKTLGGSAGVNRYFSQYNIEDNSLKLSHVGMTKMMGPPQLMKQEDKFVNQLNQVKNISISQNGETVTLKTISGEELVFTNKK